MSTKSNFTNILILDDSELFRLMAHLHLMKKGFKQVDGVFVLNNLKIYMTADYQSASDLIDGQSARHVDFKALFLDWHLSDNDRITHHDGVQIAAMGLEEKNQPLKPTVFCISAENPEMQKAILTLFPDMSERVVLVDFIKAVDKILEIGY